MKRTLVLGFGNRYRRDDGVAGAVVAALRADLGQPALDAEDDGLDSLGAAIDSALLHQLVPELAPILADYALVVFVDAHVGDLPEALREEAIEPCFRPATVSHQLHPCTLLALTGQMCGQTPTGILVSLRGEDFDFGEGLSTATAGLVPAAVDRILVLAELAES